jgi:hypothetical protein
VDKRWIVVVLCSFCYLIVRQCDSETVVFKNIIRAYIYISFRNVLSHCLTVTRGIESIVCTSPNYEESIGQSRSDNGVVTGKTAGMQDKCSFGLFPPNFLLNRGS